jgi:hypothetical protein
MRVGMPSLTCRRWSDVDGGSDTVWTGTRIIQGHPKSHAGFSRSRRAHISSLCSNPLSSTHPSGPYPRSSGCYTSGDTMSSALCRS